MKVVYVYKESGGIVLGRVERQNPATDEEWDGRLKLIAALMKSLNDRHKDKVRR